MGSKWLEEIRKAAEITAQREQRGDQLSFRDVPQTPDEPRAAHPTASGYLRATQRPVEAPQSAPRASDNVTPTSGAQAATGATAWPRRQLPPFTGRDPVRNYRAFYRAACDFHERHNPPTREKGYWDEVSEDMTATSERYGNDLFLQDMLAAVFAELERESMLSDLPF